MGKDAEIISAALVPASRAHGPERYVPKHLRCCLAFRLDDAAQPHSIACGLVSVTASLSLGPASRGPPPPTTAGHDQSVCFQPCEVEWHF